MVESGVLRRVGKTLHTTHINRAGRFPVARMEVWRWRRLSQPRRQAWPELLTSAQTTIAVRGASTIQGGLRLPVSGTASPMPLTAGISRHPVVRSDFSYGWCGWAGRPLPAVCASVAGQSALGQRLGQGACCCITEFRLSNLADPGQLHGPQFVSVLLRGSVLDRWGSGSRGSSS